MSVKFVKRTQEEDVTLMNSQCSSRCGEVDSSLFRAITKSLGEQHCDVHHQRFQYYYKRQLQCLQCFQKQMDDHVPVLNKESRAKMLNFYHLSFILNHPMLLLLDENELISYPPQTMELVLNAYRPLFSKNYEFKLQKQLLVSFTARIKNRIQALCDHLIDSFEQIQANKGSQMRLREEIRTMSKMYEDQFLELLTDKYTAGTKQQLQEVLREYSDNNWNPFAKLMDNCAQMMRQLQHNPYIDWKALTELYTTVTDDKIWKTDKMVTTYSQSMKPKSQTAQIILPSPQIILQGQYQLEYNQNGLTLTGQNRLLGHLQSQIDCLYHLSNYRLLAINYQKLQIINYFDQLTIQEEYGIPGCTEVLPFDNHLVIISKERLIYIDLHEKTYEVLGIDFRDLRYVSGRADYFDCTNKEKATVRWSLNKNKIVSTKV